MGLGVLNDPKYPNVPGTVNIHEVVDPGACPVVANDAAGNS
jgi:hypothetical protein